MDIIEKLSSILWYIYIYSKKTFYCKAIRECRISIKKYTWYAQKEKIIIEYLNNNYGFRELCRIYGMSQGALKGWIRLYNAFGFEGLRTSSQASRYSSVLKHTAVNDYLNGKYTAPENLLNRQFTADALNKKWLTNVAEFKYYIRVKKRKVCISKCHLGFVR